MSQQVGISFKEFRQRFQTEEACEAFLFEQRWPEEFICPKCGGHGCYRLRERREYVCKQYRRQSSVTAGTVLHHTLISNAKSFLLGTCHGIGKKHLQRYFDEFDFRFNRRFRPKQLFPRLVRAVAVSNILSYVDLTR